MKLRNQLVYGICLLLFLGFSTSSFVSYHLANQTFKEQIQHQNLPLTSDNIYSYVQRDLLHPVLISSLMAQDTFVKDWVENGEQGSQKIVNYLKEIQKKYQTVTAFFVSNHTHHYYHPTGILKTVSESDPIDQWFFSVLNYPEEYQINLDTDTADQNRTTIFINHKVTDKDGNIMGIIGVGLESTHIQTLVDEYQQIFGRTVFFTDNDGNIKLHGTAFNRPLNIHKDPAYNAISTQVLGTDQSSLSYQRNDEEVFVSSRLLESLGWHIMVEEIAKPPENITNALWINLVISALITLLIGFAISHRVTLFQLRINDMATKDHLTKLSTRQGFEPSFHQMLETARRNRSPLSVLLLDLDHFKRINDNFGHLQGDDVLKQVAKILEDSVRSCDEISRWGGEEFILALSECDTEAATAVAEKIRQTIEQGVSIKKDNSVSITASVGVAQFDFKESSDELFTRADKALYRAKNNGRNQVAQSAKSS